MSFYIGIIVGGITGIYLGMLWKERQDEKNKHEKEYKEFLAWKKREGKGQANNRH